MPFLLGALGLADMSRQRRGDGLVDAEVSEAIVESEAAGIEGQPEPVRTGIEGQPEPVRTQRAG